MHCSRLHAYSATRICISIVISFTVHVKCEASGRPDISLSARLAWALEQMSSLLDWNWFYFPTTPFAFIFIFLNPCNRITEVCHVECGIMVHLLIPGRTENVWIFLFKRFERWNFNDYDEKKKHRKSSWFLFADACVTFNICILCNEI